MSIAVPAVPSVPSYPGLTFGPSHFSASTFLGNILGTDPAYQAYQRVLSAISALGSYPDTQHPREFQALCQQAEQLVEIINAKLAAAAWYAMLSNFSNLSDSTDYSKYGTV